MSRMKNQDNQIAALKKQLKACQQEMAALQARHEQEIEKAAEIGYELGLLEAEEREARCAEMVADAIARFEKQHAKNAPRTSLLARANAKIRKKAPQTRGRRQKRSTKMHQPRAESAVLESPQPTMPPESSMM